MELNCTIYAYPLTNRNFWRKDGTFLQDSIKTEIKNIRVNAFTLVSQLIIKYYNELDQGLYECTAENDLRVSKMVYTLKDQKQAASQLMPIGYSNDDSYRKKLGQIMEQETTTSLYHHRRKFWKHRFNHQRKNKENDDDAEKFITRKHFRNRKFNRLRLQNQPITTPVSVVVSSDTTNSYNSPYIILLDDDYGEQKQQLMLRTSTGKQSVDSGSSSNTSGLKRILPFVIAFILLIV